MIVIVCLDDRNGMLFHGRRQSRDRVVVEDMLKMCRGTRLWMNSYSARLLEEKRGEDVLVVQDDAYLTKVKKAEYCLVEKEKMASWENQIELLIVYRWNRIYPSDFYFDLPLEDGKGWKKMKEEELIGYSHEKITKEYYQKEKQDAKEE